LEQQYPELELINKLKILNPENHKKYFNFVLRKKTKPEVYYFINNTKNDDNNKKLFLERQG
jgi:hypothetical protein